MDKEGLNLFYPSIRGISCRSLATTSVCSLSVQLNIKDKYRSPLGCLSWIRIQKYLDPTADEEGLNLSYPSIRGTSRRSWATTSACFSGDVIRRMSAELSWEMLESQIIKRVNSSATKHNKKNQCWRRNFRPEIKKKRLNWVDCYICSFFLCLVALLFTLLIILPSTISQNSTADFLQITVFPVT